MKTQIGVASFLTLLTAPLAAQDAAAHQHTEGMRHEEVAAANAGQSAFATLSETVRLLTADPKTDWSKVNIEALRQHLIDMDNVTLRAVVNATAAPGGLTMDVRGAGVVGEAIRRMLTPHGRETYRSGSTTVPLHFLTVAPGTQFELWLSPTLGATGETLSIAHSILAEALDRWGVGARTGAGYGRMDPATDPAVPLGEP